MLTEAEAQFIKARVKHFSGNPALIFRGGFRRLREIHSSRAGCSSRVEVNNGSWFRVDFVGLFWSFGIRFLFPSSYFAQNRRNIIIYSSLIECADLISRTPDEERSAIGAKLLTI